MKSRNCLFLAISFFLVGMLSAQVIDGYYMIPKTTIVPNIDGVLDPIWHNVAEIPQRGYMGILDDHADIWGFSRMMWDENNLYLFLRTQDDINFTANPNWWEKDSWTIYFDGDNSKGLNYDGVNDMQIPFVSDANYFSQNAGIFPAFVDTTGMLFKHQMADDGTGNYTLEIQFPLTSLFIDPTAGNEFGIDLQQNDTDGGVTYREAITKWWDVEDDFSWNNPSKFGTAMLWDREVSEFLDIHKTSTAPVIDGIQDDLWKFSPLFSVNSYDNGAEPPYSDEDLYGWFQLLWDNNNLYGYFSTTDDINFTSNSNYWENDSWQIYFDGDNSKGISYDGVNDLELRFHSQYSNDVTRIDGSYNLDRQGIEYVNRMVDDGTGSYSFEFKIPLGNIFIDPEFMTEIGFEAHQNDADGSTIVRESVSKWWEETGDFSWNNPSTFGTAVLMDDAISPPVENHNWSINLTIQGSQTQLIRSFGGDVLGTNGFDQNLDSFLPPTPQSFYSYFEIVDFPNHLSKDIRPWVEPFDSTIVWTLKIVNADEQNSTISWNPSSLPLQGSFKLIGNDVNVNMRYSNTVSFNGNQTFTIEYSSLVTVTYTFPQTGWYMVSLPLMTADSSVNSLFQTALGGVAYSWNPFTQNYQPTTFMLPKKGYWIAIQNPSTSQISGKPLTRYTESFDSQGWYIIGCPNGIVNFSNPNDYPNGMVWSPAFGWDVSTGNYSMTSSLHETKAYWIAVFGSCWLTLEGNNEGLSKMISPTEMTAFHEKFGQEPPGPPSIDWETGKVLKQPDTYTLLQNYPNPFNPATRIGYQMPKAGNVQLVVYDMLGRPVRTLISGFHDAGSFEAIWNGKDERGDDLGSGMYMVKMQSDQFTSIKKVLLMR